MHFNMRYLEYKKMLNCFQGKLFKKSMCDVCNSGARNGAMAPNGGLGGRHRALLSIHCRL